MATVNPNPDPIDNRHKLQMLDRFFGGNDDSRAEASAAHLDAGRDFNWAGDLLAGAPDTVTQVSVATAQSWEIPTNGNEAGPPVAEFDLVVGKTYWMKASLVVEDVNTTGLDLTVATSLSGGGYAFATGVDPSDSVYKSRSGTSFFGAFSARWDFEIPAVAGWRVVNVEHIWVAPATGSASVLALEQANAGAQSLKLAAAIIQVADVHHLAVINNP